MSITIFQFFIIKIILISFIYFLFDLELDKWGVDADELKDPSLSCTSVGWTEDWEKDKWKTYGTMLFSNKYKDLHFVLPDTGHMHYIQE